MGYDQLHIDVASHPLYRVFEIKIASNGAIVSSGLRLSQGIGSHWSLKDYSFAKYYLSARWNQSGAKWADSTFNVDMSGYLPGADKAPEIGQPLLGQHFKSSVGVTFRGDPHPVCSGLPVEAKITGANSFTLGIDGNSWKKGWLYKSSAFKPGAYKIQARWKLPNAPYGVEIAFNVD
jgi:hypothetical protein